MNTPDDIRTFIRNTVAEQLPQLEPAGIREWITERLTDPYQIRLPVDPEGIQIEEFWMVTDHKDGKHYRIAYSTSDNSFGIVTTLASGIDWYMGDYGTFKQTVESL